MHACNDADGEDGHICDFVWHHEDQQCVPKQFPHDMGPLQGGGKKRAGCFDNARSPVPGTNLRLRML
eukprot:12102138-Karenia_brevis.AAC.1